MMASYLVRLFCLCLAVFFLVHSAAALAVALSGPAAIRAAGRMRPRLAERFLLMLRLLPAALGAVFGGRNLRAELPVAGARNQCGRSRRGVFDGSDSGSRVMDDLDGSRSARRSAFGAACAQL